MIFIALVAVAVWLADLRLAIALPLVALAWLIAATIEYLAWRSARAPVGVVEGSAPASAVAPPPIVPDEPEPVVESPPVEQTIVQPVAPEPEPEPEPEADPEPEPEAVQAPEPEPEPEPSVPEPEPEPAPEPAPPPVVAAAPLAAEPEQQSRWARRKRLRAVPTPPPEPPAPVPAAPPEPKVVQMPQRSQVPRQWNLWDLERLARAEAQEHPERRDEWAYLFVHLRQFANAEGVLPTEFDSLVRESFGGLLERQPAR